MINLLIFFNLSILILNYLKSFGLKSGSDHAFHVNLIYKLKNNHRFCDYSPFQVNEVNFCYPQLLHWLLSFFPEKIYRVHHFYINLTIKIIELLSFNMFLFYMQSIIGFDDSKLLYANIVFNIFPFSYAVWNAKNTGISARHIGLIAGQIYSYLLVVYYLDNNTLMLVPLFLVVFIILLLSQMSMQYVVLSLPFYAILFNMPEIILLPFLAYGLFYLLMPKVAINYIIGQYNHKRNYALFLADIFILKERPSIYRDFFYDFWIKFKSSFKQGLIYLGMNPLVEIVYGFPFLWFIIYYSIEYPITEIESILLKVIFVCLGLFFLISFRLTRFLGEPQRYLEFEIPFISILFVIYFDYEYIIGLGLFSLIIIIFAELMVSRLKGSKKETYSNVKFIEILRSCILVDEVAISNDNDLLKYLPQYDIQVIKPILTSYFKNIEEFNSDYDGSYGIISKQFILNNINTYNINYLIINELCYNLEDINLNKNTELIIENGNYKLYKLD